MPTKIRVVPWITGECSLYAIVRDGVCLPDLYINTLQEQHPDDAFRLMAVLDWLAERSIIRPSLLRPERPELGVYALYNHREISYSKYNPSRLLCSYVGPTSKILVVGSGFVKSRNEPIQMNGVANFEAEFLGNVAKALHERIKHGEVIISGSKLVAVYLDSLEF